MLPAYHRSLYQTKPFWLLVGFDHTFDRVLPLVFLTPLWEISLALKLSCDVLGSLDEPEMPFEIRW